MSLPKCKKHDRPCKCGYKKKDKHPRGCICSYCKIERASSVKIHRIIHNIPYKPYLSSRQTVSMVTIKEPVIDKKGQQAMIKKHYRTSLKINFDILNALLVERQPITFSQLSLYTNLDTNRLKIYLDDLIKESLIKIKQEGNHEIISLTELGIIKRNKIEHQITAFEGFGMQF